MRKERRHGRSEGKNGGRKRAEGATERGRAARGSVGGREIGKRQGRYPDVMDRDGWSGKSIIINILLPFHICV